MLLLYCLLKWHYKSNKCFLPWLHRTNKIVCLCLEHDFSTEESFYSSINLPGHLLLMVRDYLLLETNVNWELFICLKFLLFPLISLSLSSESSNSWKLPHNIWPTASSRDRLETWDTVLALLPAGNDQFSFVGYLSCRPIAVSVCPDSVWFMRLPWFIAHSSQHSWGHHNQCKKGLTDISWPEIHNYLLIVHYGCNRQKGICSLSTTSFLNDTNGIFLPLVIDSSPRLPTTTIL